MKRRLFQRNGRRDYRLQRAGAGRVDWLSVFVGVAGLQSDRGFDGQGMNAGARPVPLKALGRHVLRRIHD